MNPRMLRLAKEARKLAMEVKAGTAPAFGTGVLHWGDTDKPCCCLGHLGKRAGFSIADESLWRAIPRDHWNAIARANDHGKSTAPALLALADALEEA